MAVAAAVEVAAAEAAMGTVGGEAKEEKGEEAEKPRRVPSPTACPHPHLPHWLSRQWWRGRSPARPLPPPPLPPLLRVRVTARPASPGSPPLLPSAQ